MSTIIGSRIKTIVLAMDKNETDYFFSLEVARRYPNAVIDIINKPFEVTQLNWENGLLTVTLEQP